MLVLSPCLYCHDAWYAANAQRWSCHLRSNAGTACLFNLLAAAEESVHDQGAGHLLLIEEALHQTLRHMHTQPVSSSSSLLQCSGAYCSMTSCLPLTTQLPTPHNPVACCSLTSCLPLTTQLPTPCTPVACCSMTSCLPLTTQLPTPCTPVACCSMIS